MKGHSILKYKKYIWGIILSAFLIAIDQLTKLCAVRYLKDKAPYRLIQGVFELSYLENRGAAFGILQNHDILFFVFTVIILAVLLYVYCVRIPNEKRYHVLHMIAILFFSGAVGNFIDRTMRNYVVDFFYFKLIHFPIFNVADIYIVVAAGLLIGFGLFYYKDSDFERIFPSKRETDKRT